MQFLVSYTEMICNLRLSAISFAPGSYLTNLKYNSQHLPKKDVKHAKVRILLNISGINIQLKAQAPKISHQIVSHYSRCSKATKQASLYLINLLMRKNRENMSKILGNLKASFVDTTNRLHQFMDRDV